MKTVFAALLAALLAALALTSSAVPIMGKPSFAEPPSAKLALNDEDKDKDKDKDGGKKE
jgi:hypothetical protein